MKRRLAAVILLTLISLIVAGCTAGRTLLSAPTKPLPPPTVTAQATAFPTTAAATSTTTVAPALRTTATSTRTPTAPPSPTTAPAPTSTPTAAPFLTAPKVTIFVSGLDTPWAIAFAPDGRIFITERPGRIRVVKDGKLDPEPWMTLEVTESGEAGLLGLALDPEFAKNRLLFVAYTYQASGSLRNRLVRLREDAATGKGVLDKVLFDGVLGNVNHDGGRVKFGPDGLLYWTVGDAQNAAAAQDLSSPNGKILRLRPDGAIPPDNPFAGSPIYSYGHRNSEGLAWQPETNRLYATEHGPSSQPPDCCQDEINLIEPGKNYGWPVISGDATKDGMASPVIDSGKNDTWAPGGATFVTTGPWKGSLLFTGLRGQALYRLTLDSADPRRVLSLEPLLKNQYGRLRDVAQGPDGAIYVLTSNGDGRGTMPPDGDRVLRLTFTD